ncbi:MAG: hypothetical protein DME67_07690 [Verrucomicrobia bacterium]|nr:MAG: hypothetical protein DME95_06470 [Verrucomicrobiota bacterium]PYK04573.1 MAG: hypothetical protein DME67_07690 [Verrucomicrobiota bacterium]
MSTSLAFEFSNPVIPSVSEGPHIRRLITQGTLVCSSSLMRDSSTSLRCARNDRGANRAFAHFRW